MATLSDLKLWGLVFALPASSEPAPSEKCLSLCGAYMEAMEAHSDILGEQIRHALHAALLLPFRKMVNKEKKGKSAPVVNYILKASMKRNSSDAETVVNIHRPTGRFLSLILPLQLKNGVQVDKREWGATEHLESICQDDPSKIRVVAGFLLKDIKDLWRVALLTSLLLSRDDDDEVNLDKKREIYLSIEGTIREMCLDTIWDEKPLVDGFDIIKALQLTNRGPIIREWQQKLLTWQLAYPKGMPTKRAKPNVSLE